MEITQTRQYKKCKQIVELLISEGHTKTTREIIKHAIIKVAGVNFMTVSNYFKALQAYKFIEMIDAKSDEWMVWRQSEEERKEMLNKQLKMENEQNIQSDMP